MAKYGVIYNIIESIANELPDLTEEELELIDEILYSQLKNHIPEKAL